MALILVIDGEETNRVILRLMLEADGHETIEVATGDEGLKALDLAPDAVFVDMDLPGMPGQEFLGKLRQHRRRAATPAAFVTAHREQTALQLGIDEKRIIGRPFQRQEVRSAVDSMVGPGARRNLRVALAPGQLTAQIGEEEAVVTRLGERQIHVRGFPPLASGSAHTLQLGPLAVQARVSGESRGETRFTIDDPSVGELIKTLLSDSAEDLRNADRLVLSATVQWEREGAKVTGDLRDISAGGAYVVTDTKPPIDATVMVYIPMRVNDKTELRGSEARVIRHGRDGFACEFATADSDFFVALNAMLDA